MTENHFRSHFSPFQINTQLLFIYFFTKWLPAANLDDRKSLSIAFFSISDQYATSFLFFSKWPPAAIEVQFRPFWMTENHFRSHFSPFGINTQLFLYLFSQNGCRGGCFVRPKITFDRIFLHFRSIRNFLFFKVQNGRRRPFFKSYLGHFG